MPINLRTATAVGRALYLDRFPARDFARLEPSTQAGYVDSAIRLIERLHDDGVYVVGQHQKNDNDCHYHAGSGPCLEWHLLHDDR